MPPALPHPAVEVSENDNGLGLELSLVGGGFSDVARHLAFEGGQLAFVCLCLAQVRQPVARVRSPVSLVRGLVSLIGHLVSLIGYLISFIGGPVTPVVVFVAEILAVVLQPLAFIELRGVEGRESVALLGVDLPLLWKLSDRIVRSPFDVSVHADDYSPTESSWPQCHPGRPVTTR